VFSCHRSIKTT